MGKKNDEDDGENGDREWDWKGVVIAIWLGSEVVVVVVVVVVFVGVEEEDDDGSPVETKVE